MNLFIIILIIAIVATVLLYIAFKNAEELPEEQERPAKFEPRKVTYISTETEIPKKKYYKKRNKKKKSAVAQNDTAEKRPVGRPRKTTE
jgi:hypothetical protein